MIMALEYFENVNNMAPNEFLERSIKYAANLFFDNEEYENATSQIRTTGRNCQNHETMYCCLKLAK
jgi:hypothetical protein